MIGVIKAFGRFWYDFIVGDDWRIALGVVIAVAATYWLSHVARQPSWWIPVVTVAVVLHLSVRRTAVKKR